LFSSCLDFVYFLSIFLLFFFLSSFCILSIHFCTCSISLFILYFIYIFFFCLIKTGIEQVQQCIDNIQNRDRNRTSTTMYRKYTKSRQE
jgi:predicted PurR-regulated permease PerM